MSNEVKTNSGESAATPPPHSPAPQAKWLVGVLALAVAVGGWWYFNRSSTGTSGLQANKPAASGVNETNKAHSALTDAQLDRMVSQATEQVSANPQDKSAWAMLAHSNEMLGKFAEASRAYAKLAALAPNDAQVLADYADAVGVANGRSLLGEPEGLIKRALAADPKNLKALMLGGALAVERDDRPAAISHWERARAVSKDEALNKQIDANIESAKAAPAPVVASAALASASAPGLAAAMPRVIAGPAKLSGRVWLSDELASKASPDATVFIFARPVEGSRMPVALLRKKVKDLPLDFTLDESMGMVKGATLANIPAAVIVARVSLRGDVSPQAGDLQGLSAPLPIGTTGIKLEISEVLK